MPRFETALPPFFRDRPSERPIQPGRGPSRRHQGWRQDAKQRAKGRAPLKKFLEKRRKRGKFVPRAVGRDPTCPDRGDLMNNPAPAIFPPAGIGDRKPANQAVLDWVHEVELLTQPENIFWCDGSEARKRIPDLGIVKAKGLDQAERRESCRARICIAQIRTTSPGSSNSHLFARRQRKKRVRRTIGPNRQRPIRNCRVCSKARCAAAPCLSCPTSWDRPIRH